ncbi:MAG TPA: hypothetical protein VMU36_08385 [Spirochaetia bacterium]|nr:hypothetical protein [Spirochaetia bacterium]
MSLEDLVVSMNRLGIGYTVLESGAEGAVLVLPEYGRVLGVWPHWRGENALWVNPEFLRLLEIGAKDDGWSNPGGDRIWLGPREEFFPAEAVPPSVDPGKYEGASEKGIFSMENRGDVRAWKSDMILGFHVLRRIRPLGEEEISELWGTRWLRQAGYTEETTLEVSREIPPSVWLWNLTQIRGRGELLRGKASPAGGTFIGIEERDDGRGQLLVKSFRAASAGPGSRLASDAVREIACASPPAGGRDSRRVLLRTILCAFSGRVTELRAAALRIASLPPLPA